MANSTSLLGNQTIPMASLPPEGSQLYHVMISAYIMSGTSGVIIWDVLNNLARDYKLVSQSPFKVTTAVYILSRLTAMVYVLGFTIFTTAPIGHCFTFGKSLGWLFSVAVPSSALLFLFRVKAVYNGNPYVIAFFVLAWLAVVGSCLTSTKGVLGVEIGSTRYCTSAKVASYTTAAAVTPVMYDTLVFLAISWRLTQNAFLEDANIKRTLRTMIYGDYLPAFSRGLLKCGQVYYLSTVSFGLLTVVMVLVKGDPAVYKTVFTVPNTALMNIMACRVFRWTKFGDISNTEIISSFDLSRTANGDTVDPRDIRMPALQVRCTFHREDESCENGTEMAPEVPPASGCKKSTV